MANKLHRLSNVFPDGKPKNRAVKPISAFENGKAYEVLFQAQQYWLAMDKFRIERERNKNYCYGKQWEDIIKVKEIKMKEADYIRSQGSLPLKNNLIRRMVQSILGVYRSQSKEPTCVARDRDEQQASETMSTVLQYNMQLNRRKELDARTFEEFCISGLAIHRKWYGWRDNMLDCWTDYVQPNNFFIDCNMRDFRGIDVSCLGEIHDLSLSQVWARFAKTRADKKRLADIYAEAKDGRELFIYYDSFGYPTQDMIDFLVPHNTSLCRVIEVWRKESSWRYHCHDFNSGNIFVCDVEDAEEFIFSENRKRLEMAASAGIPEDEVPLIEYEECEDEYWVYYYLTPYGDILEYGESPYLHKSHPYVFKAWPFIDGEIHSFVNNVIDQQRYVNRLITMHDWIMRASAKGVLIFPEECLPDGMSIDDVADEWGRFDGVIAIKAKPGAILPQQIANNSTNIGISELLNMQLKLFEDISGVNGAIQGKQGFSGMSASLYNQQTQNATMSLLDILETFSAFVVDGAYKDVSNMQQYYDTVKIFNIAGRKSSKVIYNPEQMQNIIFDISIVESTATPAYRAMATDMLLKFWEAGAISIEMLLENADIPFADNLLQSIKSQREQIQNGQVPEGVSPELMQQAQQGADMAAVNKAQQILGYKGMN